MNFIKKHTIESIALIVFLLLIVVGGGIFLSMWNQGTGTKYGSRLEGIKKVKIDSNDLSKIENKLKESDLVAKTTSDIEGRIINILITVNTGTDANAAKELANTILDDNFSKDELAFYDIQVYLLEKDAGEGTVYPKIGYKSKNSNGFVWSNN